MYSTIHFSLLADLMLGAVLISLWLIRRNDRYALYWGVGQMMIGLTTAIWSLYAGVLPMQILAALIVTVGVCASVAGTQHFCARPIYWR